MVTRSTNGRPWTFYALAAFFTLFVLFLYGPMSAIFILSFQGPNGGLTFPMNGVSLHWFGALFAQQRSGDFVGSFSRSIALAILVLAMTVVISIMAGLAFRYRFACATAVFYMAIGSRNTLPLEIWAMTTDVTSPALYALGTLTTAVSFVVIAAALTSIALIQRRRARRQRGHPDARRGGAEALPRTAGVRVGADAGDA